MIDHLHSTGDIPENFFDHPEELVSEDFDKCKSYIALLLCEDLLKYPRKWKHQKFSAPESVDRVYGAHRHILSIVSHRDFVSISIELHQGMNYLKFSGIDADKIRAAVEGRIKNPPPALNSDQNAAIKIINILSGKDL